MGQIRYLDTVSEHLLKVPEPCEKAKAAPTITTRFRVPLGPSGTWGVFPGSLTSPKRRAGIRRPVDIGASGWMVGADPKFRTHDRAGRVISPRRRRYAASPLASMALDRPALACSCRCHSLLVQCGKAPSAGNAGRQRPCLGGDTFEDRFPAPQFSDRFPTASESLGQRQARRGRARTHRAAAEPRAPYRVASLAPTLPYQRPRREDQTTLVGLKSSAFPYLGNNPRTDEPFLNISKGERRGHRSYGGRVYWQDETYNDNRTLMHVPEHFDARKPGVIVVFFHGNGATLERDVRDRQLVPQQISDSGVNAVLLAPQLAVDAADSSAGKFWQPGGLKRFVDGVGRSPRPALRRSARRQDLRQHAGHHRRLQRRLHAGGLEPGGRRPRQSRARRVPARCGVWRTRQIRVLDRQQPHRLLCQRLYPFHPAARKGTDGDAEGKKASRYRRTWTGRCGPAASCSSRRPRA